MKTLTFVLAILLSMYAVPVHAARQPYLETGPDAEQSVDGLYRVKDSRLDSAWIREGTDLSGYSKLLVRRSGASLRAMNWSGGPAAALRRGKTDSPLTEEDREKLARALRDEALAELANGERFQLADQPGEDVLLMVVGLIDVVSHVPPEGPGSDETVLHSVSEATLVLELRDSVTGAVLARAADRRAAGTLYMRQGKPVTHDSELKRLGGSWGRLLRERLDELIATSEDVAAGKP